MAISRMSEAACVAAMQKATETGNARQDAQGKFLPCSAYAEDLANRLRALGRGDLIGRPVVPQRAPVAKVAHHRPTGPATQALPPQRQGKFRVSAGQPHGKTAGKRR